ncbi:unnamed protein product [Ixodes pacificus]
MIESQRHEILRKCQERKNEEGKEIMSKTEGTVMLRLATVARRKKNAVPRKVGRTNDMHCASDRTSSIVKVKPKCRFFLGR